jgi:hypothetical protein
MRIAGWQHLMTSHTWLHQISTNINGDFAARNADTAPPDCIEMSPHVPKRSFLPLAK